MEVFECSKCNKLKFSNMFYPHKTGMSGVPSECRECQCIRQIECYVKKETPKEIKPRLCNEKSNSKEYRKFYNIKNRSSNFERSLLYSIKSSAKKRGLDFNLTIDDIDIPKYCPYLNLELTRTVGVGATKASPSIDRIDNDLGYVKGNIRIISNGANKLKGNLSIAELLAFAKNIIYTHSK